MSFAAIEGAGKRKGKLADEAVVGNTEVTQLEGKGDEVGEEVWGVEAAVDKDGAVDVGVGQGAKGG